MVFLTADPIDLGALLAQVQSPRQRRDRQLSRLGARSPRRASGASSGVLGLRSDGRSRMRANRRGRRSRSGTWCRAGAPDRPLEIGDAAVAIVAASAHRDEAFAACRYVIEEVKRRVPIWKREVYADGIGRVGRQRGSGTVGAGSWSGGHAAHDRASPRPACPLTDVLRRPLKSLRISVTDRCNMRCRYCMPEAGVRLAAPRLHPHLRGDRPPGRASSRLWA